MDKANLEGHRFSASRLEDIILNAFILEILNLLEFDRVERTSWRNVVPRSMLLDLRVLMISS